MVCCVLLYLVNCGDLSVISKEITKQNSEINAPTALLSPQTQSKVARGALAASVNICRGFHFCVRGSTLVLSVIQGQSTTNKSDQQIQVSQRTYAGVSIFD